MKLETLMYVGLVMILLFGVVNVSAKPLYAQVGTSYEIIQTCTDGSSMCDNCTITSIKYNQNSQILLSNTLMETRDNDFNYTLTFEKIGTYTIDGVCLTLTDRDTFHNEIIVNGYGEEVSTSQTIGYVITLALCLLIFFITCYGAYKIKFKNNRDEEGKVISINDFKYWKVVLIIFAYLEFLFIVSIAKNLALGFLLNDGIYNLLYIIYMFLLIALIPFFPLLIFFTIMVWLTDKKTMRNIKRGIPEW